ncbi:conserved hypothetical protein [sediment metagenome]|uniref:Uncharacterized protein n=1 Tax=sediment metagenome TaxID=749907 RepID=D9PJT5_9ZZZZ
MLFISHGVSYYSNFIQNKEYERVSPDDLMASPYTRIFIMHLTVIFGAALVINISGQSVGPLIVLTVLKTTVDLFSHYFEHNRLIPGYQKSIKIDLSDNLSPNSLKMILPNFERYAYESYKKSVENGKWEEIKKQLDPETSKYVEEYWAQRYKDKV